MNDRSIYFCAFDFSVVCLFGGAIIYADDKYCATDICPPGAEHVACGRDIVCFSLFLASIAYRFGFCVICVNIAITLQEWNSRCSDDAEFIEFTPQLQQIILDAHNKLRNQQANGDTPGFGPAKRMATMVKLTSFVMNVCVFATTANFFQISLQTWDEELAHLAKFNTMKCKIEHDECQSTGLFYLAGQNLALTGDAEAESIAETRPGSWFKEYEYADMDEIRSHTSLKGSNG